MNILTGVVFCVLVISLICTAAPSNSEKETDTYAGIAAVSLIFMILIVGHWIAVLLGRL